MFDFPTPFHGVVHGHPDLPVAPGIRSRLTGKQARTTKDIERLFEFARHCPVCDELARRTERFLTWFMLEGHTDPETVRQIACSHGFCATHTRLALARPEACWAMPQLFAAMVSRAIRDLDDEAGARPAGGRCSICTRIDDWTRTLTGDIANTLSVAEAYEALQRSPGLCAPHAIAVIARGPARPDAIDLGRHLLGQLRRIANAPGTVGEHPSPIWGVDTPHARQAVEMTHRLQLRNGRAGLYAATHRGSDETVDDWLQRQIDLPGCPACAANEAGTLDYINWLATAVGRTREPEARECWLCSQHLALLHSLDNAGARTVDTHMQRLLATRILHFLRRVRSIESLSLNQVPASAWYRGRPAPKRAARKLRQWLSKRAHYRQRVDELVSPTECRACRAGRTRVDELTRALVAGLDAPPLSRRYRHSFGLCYRHVHMLQSSGHAARKQLYEHLRVRLALLHWELRQSIEKGDWKRRYDPHGAERTAWSRTAPLMDGAVCAGGAPADIEMEMRKVRP